MANKTANNPATQASAFIGVLSEPIRIIRENAASPE
jgi:hypothetical protein